MLAGGGAGISLLSSAETPKHDADSSWGLVKYSNGPLTKSKWRPMSTELRRNWNLQYTKEWRTVSASTNVPNPTAIPAWLRW